jgi:hypothetical protein
VGSLFVLSAAWSSVSNAAAARGAKSASHLIDFRDDDLAAQRIAKRLLRNEIAQQGETPSRANGMRTAWVGVAHGSAPQLFVMYGCSPTGTCGLYGFERARGSWRLVLNSLAQSCSILHSSHEERRDISARMHGSATEASIKTYWWRTNRYVRVSVRDVIYK